MNLINAEAFEKMTEAFMHLELVDREVIESLPPGGLAGCIISNDSGYYIHIA
jgi:hypothetical protein